MTRDHDPPVRASRVKAGPFIFWAVASILYALPLAISLIVHADLTVLANEALAYRYFAIERIGHGEGGNVWLPQGHTTTAIHKAAAAAVDLADSAPNLRARLNLFAYLCLAANAALVATLFAFVAKTSVLTWDTRALIALLVLAPVYGAGLNGLQLHVTPDYQSVSTILLGFALYIILVNDRLPVVIEGTAAGIRNGTLIGLLVANKITLALPAFLLALLTTFRSRISLPSTVPYVAALVCGALVTFVLVLLVFYDFRAAAIPEMFPRWLKFVSHPGSEPNFPAQVEGLIRLYFGLGLVYALMAVGIYVASVTLNKQWTLYRFATLFGAAIILAGCGIFIVKRPAQSTFFEVFVFLLFTSSALLGTAPLRAWRNWIGIFLVVLWLSVTVYTFPMKGAIDLLKDSHKAGNERWAMFEDTLKIASGKSILAVIPSDDFAHQGVFELLLKGSAVFPTWEIDKNGRRMIDRYSPNLMFFHEYGYPPSALTTAVSRSTVVVWFDRTELPPLSTRYGELAKLQSSTIGCQTGEFTSSAVRMIKWWRCVRSD